MSSVLKHIQIQKKQPYTLKGRTNVWHKHNKMTLTLLDQIIPLKKKKKKANLILNKTFTAHQYKKNEGKKKKKKLKS